MLKKGEVVIDRDTGVWWQVKDYDPVTHECTLLRVDAESEARVTEVERGLNRLPKACLPGAGYPPNP